jgi:hypothetical protein
VAFSKSGERSPELLFEFHVPRTGRSYRCELCEHDDGTAEVFFFEGDRSFCSQTFRCVDDGTRIRAARDFAIAWAEHQRRVLEGD